MVLLQLLPLLATTVALAVGSLCPEVPFTDINAIAKTGCVNGNYHVSCPNDDAITVYVDGTTHSFDDLISIDSLWFGLKCGADAVLLEPHDTLTLACPLPPLPPCGDHNCAFLNPGGAEPQNSCIGGNRVKSCPDGNLFIGKEEYTQAACAANGKWAAWNCEGDVEFVEGGLNAACSKIHCDEPVWLTPSQIEYIDWAVDTSQMTTDGQRFTCKEGTEFGVSNGDKTYTFGIGSKSGLYCNVFDGKWINPYKDFVDSGLGVGCIKPSCPASLFLEGTENELATIESEFVMTYTEMDDDEYFDIQCPTGSSLAYLDGSILEWETTIVGIKCTGEDGWMGWNATSTSIAMGSFKYGCFAPKCSNSLTYMAQTQVSSYPGVIVDVNQKATFTDGAFQLKCALGSQFAVISESALMVQNWWLTCGGASGWMVKEEGEADVAYSNVAVGCIKPTCNGMELFDSYDDVLEYVYYVYQYELIEVSPSYNNGQWELKCPSDCTLGQVVPKTENVLTFDTSMQVTCESGGWWVRTSSNTAGSPLMPTKIGCFKKVDVPMPETCPELSYLVQADFTSFPGVAVTEQTAVVSGESQLKCSAGSQLAYFAGSMFLSNSWLTCAGAASGGWRLKDAAGSDIAFSIAPVACVKPTCEGLTLFTGTEPLLAFNPMFELLETQPTWSAASRFELVCPYGTSIGYDDEGSFVFDATVTITCEADGWWLKSSTNAAGSTLVTRTYGCFRKIPNCPAPTLITQPQLSGYVGISVDTTQNITTFVGGGHQYKCLIGTYMATLASPESTTIQLVDWYLSCHDDALDGWRIRTELGGNEKLGSTKSVACIKPSCTGILAFDGTENILRSYPQYQFVAATPSYNDPKFELVCPPDSMIGYAYNVSTLIVDASIKVSCENAGWWMKTSTNANGVAILPVKYGCFKRAYVPSTRCPAPKLLNQTLVASWVGISVDTVQTSVQFISATPPYGQVKCSGESKFAFISGTSLTRQDWWMTCHDTTTTGWRLRSDAGKNDAYNTAVAVGCVKPTCSGLQLFDGSEYILGLNSGYQVESPALSMVTNGKFMYTCPSGSTFGYASSETQLTVQAGITLTCETAGWWMKTTTNTAGSLLTQKIGCFKTITAPSLPAQCETGINYFIGTEKILRDNSDYACTGDEAKAVNGIWKLNCPTGASVGYAESETTFAYAPGTNIVCGAAGWMVTTSSDSTGTALTYAKVGCFMPVTCPKTSLHLFTGLEKVVTSSSLYAIKGSAVMWKDGKAELECSSDADGIAIADNATSLVYEDTMTLTCESTGWTVKTAANPTGSALASAKVGCFKKKIFVPTANCPAMPYLTQDLVSNFIGVTFDPSSYIQSDSGVNQLICDPNSLLGHMVEGGLVGWGSSLKCEDSDANGWTANTIEKSRIISATSAGCIKPTCGGVPLFDGSEPLLAQNPSFVLTTGSTVIYPLIYSRFTMICPPDSEIGYTLTGTTLKVDPTVRVTCEGAGWTVKGVEDPSAQVASTSTKFGCFKKAFVPTGNCPALIHLTEGDLSGVVGVEIGTTVEIPLVSGKNIFGCRPGWLLLYKNAGELKQFDGSVQCDSTTDGWRMRGHQGGDQPLNGSPVGCIRETCDWGLMMFDGSEPIIPAHPRRRFDFNMPSFNNSRIELNCPRLPISGFPSYLVYIVNGTELFQDNSLSVSCQDAGWEMTHWPDTPNPPAFTKFGCFGYSEF